MPPDCSPQFVLRLAQLQPARCGSTSSLISGMCQCICRSADGASPPPPAWLTSSCLQKALAGVDRTLAAKIIVCCMPWPRHSGP